MGCCARKCAQQKSRFLCWAPEQRVHGDGPSDDIESDLHINLLPDEERNLPSVQLRSH